MRSSSGRLLFAVGIAALSFAAACHRSTPVVSATPSQPASTDDAAARARDAAARAEAARRDSLARVAQARADSIRRAEDARRLAEEARNALLAPVHFDFDRDEIPASEHALLERKVAILTANPAVQIRIEGNADDRGSDEYNLALGMRRASAVRQYLTARGIGADRLTVSSNGEERPLCQTQGEPCWGTNRRDDVVITAGGDRIVANR
jgi:peptidoglycan-associated lipoprotein